MRITITTSLLLIIIFYSSGSTSNEQTSSQRIIYQDDVEDIDGNIYKTVKIGRQIWMAENLKVTRFRNGSPIPKLQQESDWSIQRKGAYCVDMQTDEYANVYGLLYNFYAVDDQQGLSPEGWRIPNKEDWHQLIEYLGGESSAGGKMKDTGSALWLRENRGMTNESGFSALPSGGRGRLGDVGEVGYYATWWSSSAEDSLYAWHWGLYPEGAGIRFNPGHKTSGFSVRCIKEQSDK